MTPLWRQTPLERCARVAASFQASQEELWSSMWPLGHCAVSSLLLCPLLRCADEAGCWRVAAGLVASSYRSPRLPLRHAWCESAAGDVIDPTYGQFDGDPLLVLPAREAGQLGHYASLVMTLDEEEAARRSISPSRSRGGWTASSSVKVFFGLVDLGM